MAIRRYVTVKGSVSGTAFNRDAARIAAAVKVNGWVRAYGDDRVEACFEGRKKDVEAMVSWCFIGPRLARVDEVIVSRKSYRDSYCNFRIIAAADPGCLEAAVNCANN